MQIRGPLPAPGAAKAEVRESKGRLPQDHNSLCTFLGNYILPLHFPGKSYTTQLHGTADRLVQEEMDGLKNVGLEARCCTWCACCLFIKIMFSGSLGI